MKIKTFESFNQNEYFQEITWEEWKTKFENKFINPPYDYILNISKKLDELKCPWNLSIAAYDNKERLYFKDANTQSDLIKYKNLIEDSRPKWGDPSLHLTFYPFEHLRKGSYQSIDLAEDEWFIVMYDKYVPHPKGTHKGDNNQKLYYKNFIYKCDQLDGLFECLEYLMKTKDQIEE